jgi:hypothetical protein
MQVCSGDTGWQLFASQGEHSIAAAIGGDEDTNTTAHLGLPVPFRAANCGGMPPIWPMLNYCPMMLVTECIPVMPRPRLHQRIWRHISYI